MSLPCCTKWACCTSGVHTPLQLNRFRANSRNDFAQRQRYLDKSCIAQVRNAALQAAVVDVPAVNNDGSAVEEAPPADSDGFDVPAAVLERNAEFAKQLQGEMILAPLTRGCHVPFRRLCMAHGANVTMSEMAFARQMLKGDRKERARLYKRDDENMFGVQIATNTIDEGVRAAAVAADAGARWVDINCGCPIYEVTRRGMGAVLLRRPKKLAKLVHGIVRGSSLPVTVKIRTGDSSKNINAAAVVQMLQQAGAAAVTIHGRTMEQRYKKAADWELIASVATEAQVPIIGNGDILTHYEARRRLQDHGCTAIMAGRGALIKPWLFEEFKQGCEIRLTAMDRVGLYRELVSYMKEHFGDDERGRRKAWYFLPWHFSFFCRYRPLPEDMYGAASQQHPLICTRMDLADASVGETLDALPPLERLLRCENEAAHEHIAAALWDSSSDAHAAQQLASLAGEQLLQWEQQLKRSDDTIDAEAEG